MLTGKETTDEMAQTFETTEEGLADKVDGGFAQGRHRRRRCSGKAVGGPVKRSEATARRPSRRPRNLPSPPDESNGYEMLGTISYRMKQPGEPLKWYGEASKRLRRFKDLFQMRSGVVRDRVRARDPYSMFENRSHVCQTRASIAVA